MVVGIMQAKGGSGGGGDEDDVVVMPYTTAQTRLKGDVDIGHMFASAFSIELPICSSRTQRANSSWIGPIGRPNSTYTWRTRAWQRSS